MSSETNDSTFELRTLHNKAQNSSHKIVFKLKILLIREPRNCHITYQSDINGNSPIEGGIVPEKKLLLALLSFPISLAHYKFHVHTVRI